MDTTFQMEVEIVAYATLQTAVLGTSRLFFGVTACLSLTSAAMSLAECSRATGVVAARMRFVS